MNDTQGNKRTLEYVRQLKSSLIFRIISILFSFLTVPLLLRFMGTDQFGVWATILGIFSWMSFFDFGIGNGLRNKVAELIANNSTEDVGQYIGSTYLILGLIACIAYISVFVASYFLNWQFIFNTTAISSLKLAECIRVLAFFISLNFILSIVVNLLGAVQKTSYIAFGQLACNATTFLILKLTGSFGSLDLISMAYIFGSTTVGANIFLSFLFYKKYSIFAPRKNFAFKHSMSLVNVGLQFFVIQILVLLRSSTDKILITQLMGPQVVVPYDVVFRYFNIAMFAHSLLISPLWSAYTDAYYRCDYSWIKRMLKTQISIFVLFFICIVLMTFFSKEIINQWIGETLNIPPFLPVFMGIYTLIGIWNNIFAMFINGTGRIKLQMMISLISVGVSIPLTIYMYKYTGLGLYSVIISQIVSFSLAAIVLPIQSYYLTRETNI